MLTYSHLNAATEIGSKTRCIIPCYIYYLFRHVIPGFMISEMHHVVSSATDKWNNFPFTKAFHHTKEAEHSALFVCRM